MPEFVNQFGILVKFPEMIQLPGVYPLICAYPRLGHLSHESGISPSRNSGQDN